MESSFHNYVVETHENAEILSLSEARDRETLKLVQNDNVLGNLIISS